MERFVKGSVVVVPLPYADGSGTKNRPALILKDCPGQDIWQHNCKVLTPNDATPLHRAM